MYPISVRTQAVTLVAEGSSRNAVSKQLGVSRAAIRAWLDDGVEPKCLPHLCFVCDTRAPRDGAAYSALLGYYLGDGCISQHGRTFVLRVSCDRCYPNIIEDLAAAITAVTQRGGPTFVDAPGVVVVKKAWQHWPCVFPQHGHGRKHTRRLVLQRWQDELVHHHPTEFLRGLFHSDGCRAHNWTTRVVAGERKRYEYPRWQFTNHSADIMAWCQDALDLLEIPWRQSYWKTLSVSTRAGVARLDELIGPKS